MDRASDIWGQTDKDKGASRRFMFGLGVRQSDASSVVFLGDGGDR